MKKLDSVQKRMSFIYKLIAFFSCLSLLLFFITSGLLVVSYFINNQSDAWNNIVFPILRTFLLIFPIEGIIVFFLISLYTKYKLVSKKRVEVKSAGPFYDFSRFNCLVIDEGESLFNERCAIKEVVPIGKEKENQIVDIVGSIASKVDNEDPMIYALGQLSYIPLYIDDEIEVRESGYLTNYNGRKYVLGKLGSFKYRAEELVKNKIEPYLLKGYEIDLVGRYEYDEKNKKYMEFADVFGIIVAKNEINDDARAAIKHFQNMGKEVKLLSSGNALAASEQANAIGIKNSEKFIHGDIYGDYVVYGGLNKKQKQQLIDNLEKEGKVVLVFSSWDDISNANCSLSLSDKSSADILVPEKDASIINTYEESVSFANKLKKVFVLETFKTVFVGLYLLITASLSLAGFSYDYRSIYLGVVLTTIVMILLAFDEDRVAERRFFARLLSSSILTLLSIVTLFVLYFLQYYEVAYTGINNINVCLTLCASVFALIIPVVFFSLYKPFNNYRIISFSTLLAFILGVLGALWAFERNIMGFYFYMFNGQNILSLIIIVVLYVTLYIISNYLLDNYFKGGDKK